MEVVATTLIFFETATGALPEPAGLQPPKTSRLEMAAEKKTLKFMRKRYGGREIVSTIKVSLTYTHFRGVAVSSW